MKKRGFLNARGSYMLANLGHGDLLGITDAGYNLGKEIDTLDLAVAPDIPTLTQVLDVVLSDISVEKVYLAEEIKTMAPDLLQEYEARFPGIPIQFLPHTPDFDAKAKTLKYAIRTGQYMRHAPNIILQVGCTYDGCCTYEK